MKNILFKSLSILLGIVIVLSTSVCSFGTVFAADTLYYISSAGADTNSGTIDSEPLLTLAKAVELANTAGYGANDTVTVNVLTASASWGTSKLPDHSFKLVVKSALNNVATVDIGAYTNGRLGGDTEFQSIKVTANGGGLRFDNYDVIFDANSTLAASYNYTGNHNTPTTVDGQNIVLNGTFSGYTLAFGNSYGGNTYTAPLYITINNSTYSNTNYGGFRFAGGNGTTNYNSAININIKKSAQVTFKKNEGSYTFGENGVLQLINSTGLDCSLTNGELANIDNSKKWILNNVTSGYKDALGFTDTVGKYTVADGYTAIAVSGNNEITAKNGILDLTSYGAGLYEVSVQKISKFATYFVSAQTSSQEEADGTKEKPFKLITDAITKAINDGYAYNDVVTLKLLGEEIIQWGEIKETPEHDFKLIVESFDRNNYSTVNILQATYLGGPTTLKYGIYDIDDLYSQIRLNNKDFIIDSTAHVSCLYYTFGDNSTSNTITGHKVVFNNPISSPNINLSNNLHSNGKKYTGDLEVVINNPDAGPLLHLCGQAGTVYYKANVNLNVKDAKRISFGPEKTGKNVCEGAIQLIANSRTFVDPDGLEYLKTTCNPAKGFYYLINNSEYKDLLEFTTTEGKYAVDTKNYDVTAVGENGTFKAVDGFLTVSGAGEYTVTATKKTAEIDNTIYQKLENETLNLWEKGGEIIIDNAESVATIDFGNEIYDDVKISVINAEKITFTGNPTIRGVLEIAVNGNTQVIGKTIVESFAAAGGKWYITNNSDCKATFGQEEGELLYQANGKELEIVKGQTVIAPKFKNFLLNEGEYELRVKAKAANSFDNYIDYRGNNLSNTYAKLKNNKKLNVVYFGGSVTNGTGASDSNVTSWRALVGQWLKNINTNAEITNINSAVGATGSVYGTYRLDRHVLEKAPDLFFIEFSINDYLDWHHSGKDYRQIASQHLETIIRKVRTAYPTCDIVVLHTVDKAVASTMAQGRYYPEAQAHNDIAKAYNIPTINLGSALVNAIGANWSDDTVWGQYVTDTVHPNDKGYRIYFNVIKEFLTNSLIFGENSGEIKHHEMPEMVNNKLIDGDLTYHDITKDLLAESEKLGGSGFNYVGSASYSSTEYGSVKSTDTESVFVFEFTGTELALVAADGNHTGYLVKIDNSEYYSVAKGGLTKPTYLATGLTPGKHTAYIKQKDTDKTINLVNLYSRDDSKATHEHNITNYVSNYDATCQKNATKTAKCTICGLEDTIEIANSKVGCKFTYYISNNDATCQKNATETANCGYGCGKTHTREIANSKLAHTYKTTTTKATTKKNGSIVKKCSVCGKQASKTTIYYAKKVKLSSTEYTYSSSKTRKPSVKVYDYKGNKISSKYYTVSYASGRKKVGKYKVTIKLKGNYSGTLTAYFTIVPKESKVEKLTAAKKSLKVKLDKVSSQATGYEIQYSTSSKFSSKYTKTKKVTSYKTTSVTLKSLKAKKTYYVRVRTYKTVSGKKYYSDWSSKKYKKTK